MKKFLLKLAVIGTMIMAGSSMTGCTPYERGLVTGAVAVAATTAFVYGGRSYGRVNSMWRIGFNNACNHYRNRYRWNNFYNYRRGWRAGRRDCW